MIDWNNDGKDDWYDDFLYHEVISKDDAQDTQPSYSQQYSNQGTPDYSKWVIKGLGTLGILISGIVSESSSEVTMFGAIFVICCITLIFQR